MRGRDESIAARVVALAALGALTVVLLRPGTVSAKPELPEWLKLDLEYRVQTVVIDPLDLSGLMAERLTYTEQRFRVDTGFRIPGIGGLYTQMDILGGVLFGDNGDYSYTEREEKGVEPGPEISSGLALTSRWPNAAGWEVGLVNLDEPLDPDSYGPILVGIEPIRINRIYGEVLLPFGILRIGRQPMSFGPGMNLHDGSRANRWGVSRFSTSTDRFLFATKISEAVRMIAEGEGYTPDRSMDDGVFLALAYDMSVQDDLTLVSDDLHQVVAAVQWKAKEPGWFGWQWKDFLLQVVFGARFSDAFGTEVFAVPVTLDFEVGPVHFLGEFVSLFGHTREVSEGMQALRESDERKRVIRDQEILMFGARVVTDVTLGPVTLTFELDYASGDADPRDETALTTYNYARDMNIGLLLFEHVLAFETERSAQVGIRNLARIGADSFPLTELRSQGRFHNAIALFPQILYRPLDSLHIRLGVLAAWSAKPVLDPIMTLLAEDGERIDDDAVNWHGGKPARYYGTEIDLQVEWRFRDFFIWTVEAAVLFPGDALRDESGDAVTSFLFENRFTFVF